MKKIISLLLCFTLLLSVVVVRAEENPIISVPKESGLLSELGIVSLIPEELDDGLTRGEFLSYVINMKNMIPEDAGNVPIFTDVTKGHMYSGYIQTALSEGIIVGSGDGSFRPDDFITLNEAVIMTVNALVPAAFDMAAENGFATYKSIAETLGLYEDINFGKSSGMLSRRNAVVLIYNALVSPTVSIGGAGGKWVITDNKTYLERIWDIYLVKGIINTIGTMSETGKSIKAGRVYIGNTEYIEDMFKVSDMFGQSVKLFYRDNDGERVIIYAFAEARNKVEVPQDNRYLGFSVNKFYFEQDGRKKDYEIDSETTVLWNNRVLAGSEFASKLNSLSAEFTFIDNDKDGIYDYVLVKDAEIYVITIADTQRQVIGSKDGKRIDLSEYVSFSIKDADGKSIEIGDIKTDDVVLVYDSGDKNTHIDITVIKDAVSGTVNCIDNIDNILMLDDGYEYKVAANCPLSFAYFEINTSYDLYLDLLGRIVYAKIQQRNSLSPIYIMKVKPIADEYTEIKALTQDGEIKKLKVADKVSVRKGDGQTESKKGSDIVNFFNDIYGNLLRQLILVQYNSKEEIKEIYQISTRNTDMFFAPAVQDWNAYRWLSGPCSFENLIQCKASTKMFIVPDPSESNPEDEFFYVGDVSTFTNDKAYPNKQHSPSNGYGFKPIVMTPGKIEADYMVIECPEKTKFSSGTSAYGMVAKMNDVYNAEFEEICKEVTLIGMSGGEQIFYYVPDTTTSKIAVGDIVEFTYTTARIVDRDIKMYYDFSSDLFDKVSNLDDNPGWRYYAGFRVTKGRVLELDNGIAKCNTMKQKDTYSEEYLKYMGAKILRFERDNDKAYTLYDGSYLKKNDNFVAITSGGLLKLIIFYDGI